MEHQSPDTELPQVASELNGLNDDLEMRHGLSDELEDRRERQGEKVWQVICCSSTL
jgi:hypothetical protein